MQLKCGKLVVSQGNSSEKLEIMQNHCEFTVECKLHPGGIEPQPIKLEFKIYPAELWIWVHWCMICCWNLELLVRPFVVLLRIYGWV